MAISQNSEILARDIRDKLRTNYFNSTLQTTTKNGVTLTNNGDGTYTLNGTTTTDSYFQIGITKLKGRYKLVGTPAIRGNSSLYEAVEYRADLGDGVILEEAGDREIQISIAVYTGTYNNTIYKPMITNDLEATYDDFIPYDYSLAYNSNVVQKSDFLTVREASEGVTYIKSGKLVVARFNIIIHGDMQTGLPQANEFMAITLRDNTNGKFSTFYIDENSYLRVYEATNFTAGHSYSGAFAYFTQ